MAIIGALDKTKHFAEFNEPLFTGSGVTSPANRKSAARTNIGALASADVQAGLSSARFTNTPLYASTVTAQNTTGTLTSAAILGGMITSTTAAAVAMTLPTGALFEAAVIALYPNVQNGDVFEFTVHNLGTTNVITFVAGANFTLSGTTPSVAGNNGITVLARRTSAGNWVAYFA